MKNFDDIFEKLQLDHAVTLTQLKSKCKKIVTVRRKYIIVLLIGLTTLFVLNYIFIFKHYKEIAYFIWLLLLIAFVICVFKAITDKKNKYPALEQMKSADDDLKKYITYFKHDLIADLIHSVDESIVYSDVTGLNEDIYLKFIADLDYKKYTKYCSEDYMKLDDFWMYDVGTFRNETNNPSKEYMIFSGLVSICKSSKNLNLFVTPKNNNYYVNKLNDISILKHYAVYTNDDVKDLFTTELVNAFKHFNDYTGSTFEIVIKNGYVMVRAHFNNIFDPNLYLGSMPKHLLYEYYRDLYEFILLVRIVNKTFK